MAELKTKATKVTPAAFLKTVKSEQKRQDALEIIDMMQEITGEPATMWGPSIIGFGKYRYTYESGRTGEMCRTGFSPRSGALTLYIGPGCDDEKLMAKLGKHKTSKACLYINKLDDVDRKVLRKLIERSFAVVNRMYPES